MSALDALHAAVIASPDDLDARLVLADALLERGEVHGEFIQLSCVLDALSDDDPRREEIETAAVLLRRKHGLAFSRRLRLADPYFNRSAATRHRMPFELRRGFVEIVRGGPELVGHLPAALANAPIVGLGLQAATVDALESLQAALPHLSHVRSLEIEIAYEQGRAGIADALARLLSDPALPPLRSLRLDGFPPTAALGAALASARGLDRLRELEFHPIEAHEVGAAFVAGRTSLRRLALSDLGVGDAGSAAIAALPRLESLILDDDSVGDTGVGELCRLASLRHLELRGTRAGVRTLRRLVGSSDLGRLHTLHLAGIDALDDVSAQRVLPALDLPSLRTLGLAVLRTGERSFEALALSPCLPRLRTVALTGCRLRKEDMRALARLPVALRTLVIRGCGLDESGLDALLTASWLGGLDRLELGGNRLGTSGGRKLAKHAPLDALRHLDVSRNGMNERAITDLLAAAPSLLELDISDEPRSLAALALEHIGHESLETLTVGTIDAARVLSLTAYPALADLRAGRAALDRPSAKYLTLHPSLERLHITEGLDSATSRILRRHFGPNLTAFDDELLDTPGPD